MKLIKNIILMGLFTVILVTVLRYLPRNIENVLTEQARKNCETLGEGLGFSVDCSDIKLSHPEIGVDDCYWQLMW